MKSILDENIEILRDKVAQNNAIINIKREAIRNVVKQPGSENRTNLYTRHFRSILDLFSENRRFMKIQFELQRLKQNTCTNGLKTFADMSLS